MKKIIQFVQIIFDPQKLSKIAMKDDILKTYFIHEIKTILHTMEKIIYFRHYYILFGRFGIQETKKRLIKPFYPYMKEVNETFYEGFGINLNDC